MDNLTLLNNINNSVPSVITFNELGSFPKRSDFIDKQLRENVTNLISKREPILFLPTDFIERTEYREFKIFAFGVLPCGTNATVEITNIPIYFNIECIGSNFIYDFKEWAATNEIIYKNITNIKLYPFNKFTTEPIDHISIYFNTVWDRQQCITKIHKEKPMWRTSSNDIGKRAYFNKVAREYKFSVASWNIISKYKVTSNIISVDISNFCKLHDDYNIPDCFSKIIERDPTLVCSWDIETYNKEQDGMIPKPGSNYNIFMIGSAYFWHYSNKPLLTVCVVDHECVPIKGVDVMVICSNEDQLILAHLMILENMSPNIMSAYNSGCFDWLLCVDKIKAKTDLIKQFMKIPKKIISLGENSEALNKYFAFDERVKVGGDGNYHNMNIVGRIPGILDVDILPVFLQIYPRVEVGKAVALNYFLKDNGLELKDDMPYNVMFKIYERSIKMKCIKKICHCNSYCDICNEFVKELDAEHTEINGVKVYLDKYKDNMMLDGKLLCCYCSKYNQNLKDFSKIAKYCVVDCIRPHQLCVQRSIYYDNRENANLSYLSLYDAIYRADGVKVINTIGAYSYDLNVAFSNHRIQKHDDDKDHYEGAFVFPPNRGFHCDNLVNIYNGDESGTLKSIHGRPLIPLDFTSLYPSLMMTYNISTDTIIKTKEEAEYYQKLGYDLYHIKPFNYNRGKDKNSSNNAVFTCEGWTIRHNGIINNTDTNIICGYTKIINGIEKNIYLGSDIGKFEACDDDINVSYRAIYGRKKLPGERMGILAYSVRKIFDTRIPLKQLYLKYSKLVKNMVDEGKTETICEINGKQILCTLDDLKLKVTLINSKQSALKILSNTFYGQSGFFRSVIYDIMVAGTITMSGQENIKKVAEIAKLSDFIIHYGDTDSIYLSCSDKYYENVDKQYYESPKTTSDRIKWWTDQVNITFKIANQFKYYVSDKLISDNGTNTLVMTFDDIAYPTLLCGKKKYFMRSHLVGAKPNFTGKIEVKGIDTKKQGQPNIVKIMGDTFMNIVMSPENTEDVLTIAEKILRNYYTAKHDLSNFKKTAKYKTDKKNVPVHMFVERMKKMYENETNPILKSLYTPPDPGDKFEYVIVSKEYRFTLTGAKHTYMKGEIMEYYNVFMYTQQTDNPMKIDFDYYMQRGIAAIFARFICYYPQFQTSENLNPYIKAEFKRIDSESIAAANEFISKISNDYDVNNRDDIYLKSTFYKKTYNAAKKILQKDKLQLSKLDKLIIKSVDDSFINNIMEYVNKQEPDMKSVNNYIKIATTKMSYSELYIIYKPRSYVYNIKVDLYKQKEASLICQLEKIKHDVYNVQENYNKTLKEYVWNLRENKDLEDNKDLDINIIKEVNVIVNYLCINKKLEREFMKFCQIIINKGAPKSIKLLSPIITEESIKNEINEH